MSPVSHDPNFQTQQSREKPAGLNESGSAGIGHTNPWQPSGCHPPVVLLACVWLSWPLVQRPTFGSGHLAVVMRWRALIERQAKGEAVIGWHRAAVGEEGADRGAGCCLSWSRTSPRFHLVSPLPLKTWRSLTEATAFTHKHNTSSSLGHLSLSLSRPKWQLRWLSEGPLN